ncbi:MAG: rhomboid family intramembrane serine protease [Verrucomicrobiae bacterium]|nr:rhomboid family intramembrane serine protease [Verrucomicrobiae bacterium]MDW7979317.1 rhomboid family intramembrane serine protease [Verrucomicrobiales bacterium]
MLDDRHYMREGSTWHNWHAQLPLSIWLVIVNAAFYAAQLILPLTSARPGAPPPMLELYLGLYPADLVRGYLWQLFTFQLLHGGLFHLVLNCAMLYMFGRAVEAALGKAHFLALYFGCGALGGLVQSIFSLAFPGHFGQGPVVGASAGVFGLIAAFAVLNWNAPITTLVAFVLPVSMPAKYLLVAELVLATLGMLQPGSYVAHAAHLGGMVGGVLYVKLSAQWRWPARAARPSFRRRLRELVSVRAVRAGAGEKPQPGLPEDLPPDEFLAREVDPILDKISAHGIQSLTERERQILELARRKIQKR